MTDHNTAVPSRPFDRDGFLSAVDAIKSIASSSPRIELHPVPDSTDVAVMVNGEPAGVLTAEQFEEVKRRIKEAP